MDFLVRPLLDQVAGLLTETARDKGLDLVVDCHPDLPAALSGDPTRLAQVVTNLVSNAVKFTEQGEVAVVASAAEDQGRFRLHVEVRDTGIGVAADRVAGLFDPFTQADASTTRVFGGTGLGLAISREIAEAMDGRLTYAPNASGGSVFTLDAVLDRASSDGEEDSASADGDDAARELLAGRRVLVVDDTDSGSHVLDDLLAYWDLEVDRAGSVDAALEQFAGTGAPTYDLVLLDLLAADRDGPLLAARLRSGAPDPQPDHRPRLLMLASAAGTDVERLRASGVDDVLVRPVLPSVLRTAMVRLVAGEQAPSASHDTEPAHKGRVLVVEDNPINQMVASGLLGALGYSSVVVDDGMAAIEAARGGHFDAILMDVQMPRMDGYAATRRIRADEGTGPRRVVIAMTAAAIEGERERCLDAGMDDFLTKPVDPAALDAVLARRVHQAVTAPPATFDADAARAPTTGGAVLDLERLAELREFDTRNYLDRAIDSFLATSPDDSARMRSAAAAGDLHALRDVAHRLAGGALNLGATAAGRAARQLEADARSGSRDAAVASLAVLEEQLPLARAALDGYRRRTLATPA